MNTLPPFARLRNVHMIAVCGTGMGSLARLFVESGVAVTGSDQNVYPPMSEQLREIGVHIQNGYQAAHVPLNTDLVVVGNVIRKDNLEVLGAEARGLPRASLPQALFHYFMAPRRRIVVTGTHGKTTTTCLTVSLLEEAGLAPSFFIGGVHQQFARSCRLGKGKQMVVEGDEYDSAFFDKQPKFLHFRPHVAIVNPVEFDHADIYRDEAAVVAAFKTMLSAMSADDLAVIFRDQRYFAALRGATPARVVSFGLHPTADWRAVDQVAGPAGMRFRLLHRGKEWGWLAARLSGRHNAMNAVAAAIVALEEGASTRTISSAIARFVGARRRLEEIGTVGGVTIVDDFAHHPTAIAATILACRGRYPGRKLWAVFEPRTASHRRNVFEPGLVDALAMADQVVLAAPHRADEIAETERFSSGRVVSAIAKKGVPAQFIPDVSEIIGFLRVESRSGDLIVSMSNGDFGGLPRKLVAALGAAQ